MPELKLTWESRPRNPDDDPDGPANRFVAQAGPIHCIVLEYAYEANVSDNDELSSPGGNEFHWYAETGTAHMEGYTKDLAEAQAKAEEATLKWLCEGLEALGGQDRTAFWVGQCKSAEAIIWERDIEIVQLRKQVAELKEDAWKYRELCK